MARGLNGDPGAAGSGGEQREGEDARWVRSFLLAQPGKTFRIEHSEDAHAAAASEVVEVAARSLTDEVVRGARSAGKTDATAPTEPH